MVRRRLGWAWRGATLLSALLFAVAALLCIGGQIASMSWMRPTAVTPQPDRQAADGTTEWVFIRSEWGVALCRDGLVVVSGRLTWHGSSPEVRGLILTKPTQFYVAPPPFHVDVPSPHRAPGAGAPGQSGWHGDWRNYVGPDWERLDSQLRVQSGVQVLNQVRALWLPHWWLLAATALLPALWLRWRRQERRRARIGCCVQCGYDLRASKDCCPECGTAIPASPVQAAGARR